MRYMLTSIQFSVSAAGRAMPLSISPMFVTTIRSIGHWLIWLLRMKFYVLKAHSLRPCNLTIASMSVNNEHRHRLDQQVGTIKQQASVVKSGYTFSCSNVYGQHHTPHLFSEKAVICSRC
jgi:hypothetical protein